MGGVVAMAARSVLESLQEKIGWPSDVAIFDSDAMIVTATTRSGEGRFFYDRRPGFRAPLLTSAPGRAYLAFCPLSQRETLLEMLARSAKEDDKPARAQRSELERMLDEIKTQGYATAPRTRRLVEEIALSVPVMVEDRVLACLTVRFAASAVPLNTALDRFLPKLRECAARISALFSEQQTEALTLDRVASTP